MRNFRLWLGRHLLFDRAVLVALGVLIVISLVQLSQARDERNQLCVFVDDEHNQDRGAIVLGERELYTKYAKDFPTFIDTRRKRQAIHGNNRRAYYAIRATRPDYCYGVRDNDVPPYPPLSAFMRQGPSPAVARALAPGAEITDDGESPRLKKGERQERDRNQEETEPARGAKGSRTIGREPRFQSPSQEPPEPTPDAPSEEPEPETPALPPTEPPIEPPPPPPSCLPLPTDPEICLPTP